MKNKIIFSIFLLTSFSLMNLYSRALRHIDMKDVKEKHQERIVEKKLKKIQEESEKQYIQSKMKRKKYDWRKELNEMMTTADVFYTTLPATGDVNLAYPDWNIVGGQGYNLSGGTVTITGSGEITDGVVASFDSSFYSTLVFDVGISGDTLLGVFPSGSGGPLLIAQSSGTYSIDIGQSSSLTLLFVAPGKSSGNVSINNLRYQRRTPINVFVPLDSPEATSFIRADPNLSNLSPEERRKKLKEMLEASDEYVEKMLGPDFPGTGAVPPGEYDPFKQAPAGEAGDTPGVDVSNFDTSKMEKDYGQVAGSMNTPSGATILMRNLMKDGFGGNIVNTTVNGQRMTGRPADILKQIQLNFPPGGV